MAEAGGLEPPTIDYRGSTTIGRSTNPFNGTNMSCMSVAYQARAATLAEGNGRRRPKTCIGQETLRGIFLFDLSPNALMSHSRKRLPTTS